MTLSLSAPYHARNTNARPVLIDLQEPRTQQSVKRREAIKAHRAGERKPVAFSPVTSSVVVG